MDSYDILVIILSIALGISTIVWIIVGVLAIKVMKKAKMTADTAAKAVEDVQEFTHKVRMVGDASAFGSAAQQIAKFFKGKKEK